MRARGPWQPLGLQACGRGDRRSPAAFPDQGNSGLPRPWLPLPSSCLSATQRYKGSRVDGFRRRKGSKVHALVASPVLPLAVALGPANSHDATVPVRRYGGLRLGGRRGRPRRRPEELCADGAYDASEIRHRLRRRGVRASIPGDPRGRGGPGAAGPTASARPPTGWPGQRRSASPPGSRAASAGRPCATRGS